MRDAGGIELGCCKSKRKLQMYEQPRAAANLRTGQCALAKACSGAKPPQRLVALDQNRRSGCASVLSTT